MFHKIGYKGGFVQIGYFGSKKTIQAWSHGEYLGDKYTSVAGAKMAITRAHRKWLQERSTEHMVAPAEINTTKDS